MKIKLRNKIMVMGVLSAVSVCLLPGVQAKYTTKGAASDKARVATFNVTKEDLDKCFEDTFTVSLEPNLEPQTYTFKMTNSSEVSVKMNASIETIGNLPLTVECSKLEEPTIETTTYGSTTYTWEDELGNSPKEYTITISWNDKENSYKYANGVEAVKLTVIASQVD